MWVKTHHLCLQGVADTSVGDQHVSRQYQWSTTYRRGFLQFQQFLSGAGLKDGFDHSIA